MNVNFKVRNIAAVQSFLRTVPRGVLKVALEAFTEYIVGNDAHGLRHADPYKFASRADAYGYTGATFKSGKPVPAGYFSAKQFKYVAWKTKGFTEFGRKEPLTSLPAWKSVPMAGGYQYKITNDTAGGFYTRDDKRQARQLGNVGWRKVSQVLADNMAGGIRAAVAAVKKHLAGK